ncbi:hypothetical Protein YC6258_02562 [Gynuella sunshinyii YC6258]|uniref:Uncharacterized protein n=1 Tax=Gynuella sunshinyii YC6258 TaxID=1445510 RepID=A0A0C5VJZ8_9GAMM|nr:hypothetical Protein YC6258_02562 [Gynuella sunshinyii YC6258]
MPLPYTRHNKNNALRLIRSREIGLLHWAGHSENKPHLVYLS